MESSNGVSDAEGMLLNLPMRQFTRSNTAIKEGVVSESPNAIKKLLIYQEKISYATSFFLLQREFLTH